jgi:hypothetical protein
MLFEFIINDLTLQVKTKLIVIPTFLAKGKLYTDIEVRTFHAPLIEEILDRLFGFYEQFDDLCFFFPKNFYNSSKFYELNRAYFHSIDEKKETCPMIIPSNLIIKSTKLPVDFTLLHSFIQNDIDFKLLSPDWAKHLPMVLQKKEEDDSSSKKSENEEEEISDALNHDPCEDFEFDETGARVNKFPYEDHARKFVKRGDVCVSVDYVCPSPPATQQSFSFSPSSPCSSSTASAIPSMVHTLPSKSSTASVSSSSFLSKFSNVFSCCMVGPPEEDVDIIHRLSQKFLNHPLVIDDNNQIVSPNVPSVITLKDANKSYPIKKVEIRDDVPDSPSVKRSKSRRVEKVVNQGEVEFFKKSVLCDDDEDCDEEKRGNLKRKRECVGFGPCANPPFKSRKTYSC